MICRTWAKEMKFVVQCVQFHSSFMLISFYFLFQTANGNVEAKVVCFYRRRDISSTLIVLADKHASKPVCGQVASTQIAKHGCNFDTAITNTSVIILKCPFSAVIFSSMHNLFSLSLSYFPYLLFSFPQTF